LLMVWPLVAALNASIPARDAHYRRSSAKLILIFRVVPKRLRMETAKLAQGFLRHARA